VPIVEQGGEPLERRPCGRVAEKRALLAGDGHVEGLLSRARTVRQRLEQLPLRPAEAGARPGELLEQAPQRLPDGRERRGAGRERLERTRIIRRERGPCGGGERSLRERLVSGDRGREAPVPPRQQPLVVIEEARPHRPQLLRLQLRHGAVMEDLTPGQDLTIGARGPEGRDRAVAVGEMEQARRQRASPA
jgi:hypothetical protein